MDVLSLSPVVAYMRPHPILTAPIVAMNPIEELLTQESLPKPLCSLYLALLSLNSPKMERLWEALKEPIPSLGLGGLL